jgi:eukaryotic-like serine/threonine-protein kinase
MTSSVKIVADGGPPSSSSRQLPRKFGPYLCFDQIGKGGMAEIFLAREKTEFASRLCVVKEIIPAYSSHARFSEMLVREAKLAARLDHANIIKVFDLGRADGELYIAMEYLEGFDLGDLLRRCTKAKVAMPFEFALGIVTSVLRALDYAHRRTDDAGQPLGIVHCDVSPSNVLVSFEGEVKLCDFGIARANKLVGVESKGSDASQALQGKAGYMSPEQARSEPIDARSDVFAAGILLWELVSGRRLYRQDVPSTLLEQARAAVIPPPPPRGFPHEGQLHAIVLRALAKERDGRYGSAAAMLREVEEYMAANNLAASALKLGSWLDTSFGSEIVTRRRMRQRAAEALEKGPPVIITPLADKEEAVAAAPARSATLPSDSSPTSIDAATVDVVPSRPDLKGEAKPAPARTPRTWVVFLLVILGLALVYAFTARTP